MTREDVRELLPREVRHYIGGRFVPSHTGEVFLDLDPHDNQPLTWIARGGGKEVHEAAIAARSAFEQYWRRTADQGRSHALSRIADTLMAHEEELAGLETLDTGLTRTRCRMDWPPMRGRAMERGTSGWRNPSTPEWRGLTRKTSVLSARPSGA